MKSRSIIAPKAPAIERRAGITRIEPTLPFKSFAPETVASPSEAPLQRFQRETAGALPSRQLHQRAAAMAASPAVAALRTTQLRMDTQPNRLRASNARIGVIQRAKEPGDIFDFIDTHSAQLDEVQGVEMKRLLYWNSMGFFSPSQGRTMNLKTINKARGKKMPSENVRVAERDMPQWMQLRKSFACRLPDSLGGGKVNFPKRLENKVFQGRGWISDNLYWRAPAAPRVRYMIHAILEWKDGTENEAPTPHITIRNAVTQANIDLDTTNPLEKGRVADKEPTRTSYSKGLAVDRDPGEMMVPDEATFGKLESREVQTWLDDLKLEAQSALLI